LCGRQLLLRGLSFQVPLSVVAHPQISVSVLFLLPLSCFLFWPEALVFFTSVKKLMGAHLWCCCCCRFSQVANIVGDYFISMDFFASKIVEPCLSLWPCKAQALIFVWCSQSPSLPPLATKMSPHFLSFLWKKTKKTA
jgi:hypothetical protein